MKKDINYALWCLTQKIFWQISVKMLLKVFLSISSEIKEPFRKFAASYTLPWLCQVNYSAIGRPAVNSQEESTSAAVEAPKWMKENIKYFLLNLMLFTSLFVFFKIKIYLSADWKHSGGSQFCILISFARQCAFSCASLESWKLCRSRCTICRQKVPCVLKGGKYTFRYKHKRNTERGKNVFKH